ncbi:MAG: DNA polymerase III subunit delta' [Pseudomonadota bacterium]|nr:DNA polymerase III subunit delta' [Pseudomonadota bacterium]
MESLLGNAEVRHRLWRAADDGRMHHCYLFEGPEGVGKAMTAMRLALMVNCLADERPCGICASCRLFLAGTHPDLVVVHPDPDRATRVITAEQARGIISALQLQRHSARRRFVIIDPVDALTEEAANALLKTFEEPPAGTQFILVTARAASLLPTVRSRSQRVRFGPVPRAELEDWLVGRGLDPSLATLSAGSPGYALRLADGEAEERREVVAQLLATVGQPLHQLFAFTEAAGKKSDGSVERTTLVVDALEELLRDTVVVASGRDESALHQAHLGALAVWASALHPGGVGRLEKAVAAARDRLRLNVNGRVVLEALLTTLNLELSQARRG